MNTLQRLSLTALMTTFLASGGPVLADDLDTRVASVLKKDPFN